MFDSVLNMLLVSFSLEAENVFSISLEKGPELDVHKKLMKGLNFLWAF